MLHRLAVAEQQHQQAGRTEIAAQDGNGDGGGIQHVHIQVAVEKRRQALFNVGKGAHERGGDADNDGKQGADKQVPQKGPRSRPFVGRSQCGFRRFCGEKGNGLGCQQRADGARSIGIGVQQQNTAGPEADPDAGDPRQALQAIGQRAGEIGRKRGGTQPDPAGQLVVYNEFHRFLGTFL